MKCCFKWAATRAAPDSFVLLGHVPGDIVGGGDADLIDGAERTGLGVLGDHPRLIDGLIIGHAINKQLESRQKEGNEQGVKDIARLFLVQPYRHHAHLFREHDECLEHRRIGVRMRHDLGDIMLPHRRREMQM